MSKAFCTQDNVYALYGIAVDVTRKTGPDYSLCKRDIYEEVTCRLRADTGSIRFLKGQRILGGQLSELPTWL